MIKVYIYHVKWLRESTEKTYKAVIGNDNIHCSDLFTKEYMYVSTTGNMVFVFCIIKRLDDNKNLCIMYYHNFYMQVTKHGNLSIALKLIMSSGCVREVHWGSQRLCPLLWSVVAWDLDVPPYTSKYGDLHSFDWFLWLTDQPSALPLFKTNTFLLDQKRLDNIWVFTQVCKRQKC